MEGNKSYKGVIILLVIIILILFILCILFATGTISFNASYENNDENNLDIKNEVKEYDVEDYIVLEDLVLNSKVTTKKVKLNNLDDSVTKNFYEQQNDVINNIHVSDSEVFNAEYKLKYFINDNILSIVYFIEETNEIGTCGLKKAVTNIDLVNNRVIPESELLHKVGVSYESIVEDTYEKELEFWKNNNTDFDYYDVTFEDFSNNKSKYLNEGLKKIPGVIYTYIENGQIKYDYYTINLDALFHPVGKGGCFNWETVTLGEY